MAEHGTSANALTGPGMGGMGSQFAAGHASTNDEGYMTALPAGAATEAPSDVVMNEV